jgi:uncharacterized protein (UPF0332 family)
MKEKDKLELIKYRVEKSKQTIEDVEFLIKNNMLGLAVNRIYYGGFYILSALALKNNFTTSKHQQLIGWFNKTFVKEKLMDKKYGQFIVKAFENRSTGDYDDFAEFKKEDVLTMFKELKDFCRKIQEFIK